MGSGVRLGGEALSGGSFRSSLLHGCACTHSPFSHKGDAGAFPHRRISCSLMGVCPVTACHGDQGTFFHFCDSLLFALLITLVFISPTCGVCFVGESPFQSVCAG